MPNETIVPVQVVLKDKSGKEIDQVTVNVPPGKHLFENLSPGEYTTTYTVPDGYYFVPPNPRTDYVPEGASSLPIHIVKDRDRVGPPEEDGPPPVPALVTLAIGSMVLMGNLALLDPFVSPSDLLSRLFSNRSTPQNPSNPSNSPESPGGRGRRDRLSSQTQDRLRDCLQANIERVLQVPSLSELGAALMGEDEASITETQQQVRELYKTVEQLYKLINECDPSFIQELLETEDSEDSDDPDSDADDSSLPTRNCVTVIVERVNIRAAPRLDSAIIAQALFGTCFQVDLQLVAGLSEQQRLAMKMGEDWYPVILPDGHRGYIFSRYVIEIDSQRE